MMRHQADAERGSKTKTRILFLRNNVFNWKLTLDQEPTGNNLQLEILFLTAAVWIVPHPMVFIRDNDLIRPL